MQIQNQSFAHWPGFSNSVGQVPIILSGAGNIRLVRDIHSLLETPSERGRYQADVQTA
jgi:hypothetical protein